ncbi:MAG: hypothetical protein MUF49_16390 [Oculatellaceae cyanobacterium Prado106]|nr:hypothetical protein [Oculatellaceae cyanobacterium Prado106]
MEEEPKEPYGLIDGFIKEKSGKPSSSRLLIIIWGLGVFGVWAYASIKSSTLQPIPESVITIIGVLIVGKTAQRFGE